MSRPKYDDHIALITRIARSFCRKKRMSAADAEDFCQDVHAKLLEKRTLDKYDGRGTLESFLWTVVVQMYKDVQNKELGKWRSSVEAQRNGPVAILLEQLVIRDGLTFEQAFETLRTNHGVSASREALEALIARLPLRISRKPQGEDALAAVPSHAPSPDALLSSEEFQARVAAVREALAEELRALDPDDRLIINWRYVDGMKVVQIAALLHLDAKRLYPRIEQLCKRLRQALERRGIDPKGLFDDEEPWEESDTGIAQVRE